jgi:ketopantoate reductase
MQGDFTEFENIVGEPLREAERLGVPTPYLKMAYAILQVMQQNTKEAKGLLDLPVAPSP